MKTDNTQKREEPFIATYPETPEEPLLGNLPEVEQSDFRIGSIQPAAKWKTSSGKLVTFRRRLS